MNDYESLPRPKTMKIAYISMSKVVGEIKRTAPAMTWICAAREFKRVAPTSWFKHAKTDWGVFPKPIENAYHKLLKEYEQMDRMGPPSMPVNQGLFKE